MDIQLSGHARDMLAERNIPEAWVRQTIELPDREEIGADGNIHYIKAIIEHEDAFCEWSSTQERPRGVLLPCFLTDA